MITFATVVSVLLMIVAFMESARRAAKQSPQGRRQTQDEMERIWNARI